MHTVGAGARTCKFGPCLLEEGWESRGTRQLSNPGFDELDEILEELTRRGEGKWLR
jgi:hypothetical protein